MFQTVFLPFKICSCGTLVHHMMYLNADIKVDGEGSSSFLLSYTVSPGPPRRRSSSVHHHVNPHIESTRTAAYQLPLQLGSPHALLSQQVLTP